MLSEYSDSFQNSRLALKLINMNAKIMIIEDVREMSDLISLYLKKEGIETFQAESAEIALKKMESWQCDLVLLDLNLPGMDGFEFLNAFRKKSSVPVVIVSARDTDEDVITGLGYGADEFVTKPFSPKVLVARIRALLRRVNDSQQTEPANVEKFGPYLLDFNSFALKKTGKDGNMQRVSLSAKEYEILSYLVKNKGKPLTPEVIYANVWNNAYGDLSGVAVYIQRLRRKIEEDPANPKYLETVFGMGYQFTNPDD